MRPLSFTLSLLLLLLLGGSLAAQIAIKSTKGISAAGCDGAIEVTAEGNAAPFTFQWSGPEGFSSTLQNISGLCKVGEYRVTVTNSVGCTVRIMAVTIAVCSSMTLNVETTPSCSSGRPSRDGGDYEYNFSPGSAKAIVTGGCPPYQYSWSTGDTGTDNIPASTRIRGNYTVTVTDVTGSTVTSTFPMYTQSISYSFKPSCGNNVSALVFTVHNPLEKEFKISIHNQVPIGIPFFERISSESFMEETVNGFFPNDFFDFQGSFTGISCSNSLPYPYRIPSSNRPFEEVFKSYNDKTEECLYDLHCDGKLFVKEGKKEFAEPRPVSGECKIDMFCGNRRVQRKGSGKKYMTVFKYGVLLESAYQLTKDPEYKQLLLARRIHLQAMLDPSRPRPRHLCHNIYVCEADFRILHGLNAIGCKDEIPAATIRQLNSDCAEIDCPSCLNFDIDPKPVCVSVDLPDHLKRSFAVSTGSQIDAFFECKPVTYRINDLLWWREKMKSNYNGTIRNGIKTGVFENSELDRFLHTEARYNEWKSSEKKFIASKPHVHCASVTFCLADFSVKSTDLDDFENLCSSTPSQCKDISLSLSPNSNLKVISDCPCVVDCARVYVSTTIYQDPGEFKGFGFWEGPVDALKSCEGSEGSETTIHAFNDLNDAFSNFGTSQSQHSIYPDGIFASNKGARLFDGGLGKYDERKSSLDSLTSHYLIDWDENRVASILTKSNRLIEIRYEDSIVDWQKNLTTTINLHTAYLGKKSDRILVGGTFSGDLYYDGVKQASAGTETWGFVLYTDFLGGLQGIRLLKGVDASAEQLIFRDHGGQLAVHGRAVGAVAIGNANHQAAAGDLFSVFFNPDQNFSYVPGAANLDPGIRLIGAARDRQSDRSYWLVRGAGRVQLDGQSTNNAAERTELLMRGGGGMFRQAINSATPQPNGADMVVGDSGYVYVGLTFKGSLDVAGQQLNSKGKEDIAVLRFRNNGALSDVRPYGGTESETVKRLMYDNGVLYFGGDLTGGVAERIIGRNQFVNLDPKPDFQRAYLTALLAEDFRYAPNQYKGRVRALSSVQSTGCNMYNISLKTEGGKAPYYYDWADLADKINPANRTGVSSGVYEVTITDANGCTSTHKVEIAPPPPFTLQASLQHGCSNGGIALFPSGGSGPFTYDWADLPGTTNERDRTGLASGTYTVTATRADGCTATAVATILPTPMLLPARLAQDQYLVGDWDGDGRTNLAVRRNGQIAQDFNFDNAPDQTIGFGNGNTDQYLVGDWNGDGKDDLAVRRGNEIIMNLTPLASKFFGNGDSDKYLVGDWDGDGKDNLAVRRNRDIIMERPDGTVTSFQFGNGNSESEYLVGDWDGDKRDNIAVRRGNTVIMDTNFNGVADITSNYGPPNANQYLVGDWDGSGKDKLAVRIDNEVLMNYDLDASHNFSQRLAYGVAVAGTPLSAQATVTPVSCFTTIIVRAKGLDGSPTITVDHTDAAPEQTYSEGYTTIERKSGRFNYNVFTEQEFRFKGRVPLSKIRIGQPVDFFNSVSGGSIEIDYIKVDGITYETEAPEVYAQGYIDDTTFICSSGYNSQQFGVTNVCGYNNNHGAYFQYSGPATGGAISLTATGGVQPYRYDWNDLPGGNDPVNRTNLPVGGNYTVTVYDATGCSATVGGTITQGSPIVLTSTAVPLNCGGTSKGSINLTVSGGQSPYKYDWADITSGTEPKDRTQLGAGTYYVTVTDALGCSQTHSATITATGTSTPPSVATTVQHTACSANTGSIVLTVTNSVTPYSYDWANISGTSNPKDQVNLPSGTYRVTVTGANGCSAVASAVVEKRGPSLTHTIVPVSCHGRTDGAIDLTVVSGSGTYTYDWADMTGTSNPQDRSFIAAGNYTVTARDAGGCTSVATIMMPQPVPLQANLAAVAASCTVNNGSINLSASGGTAPYRYDWSDLAGTDDPEDRSGLAQGTYTVTVRDVRLCTATGSIAVGRVSGLQVSVSTTGIPCAGGNNGDLNVLVANGRAPYSYLWADGATQPTRSGLAAGPYTVTVTDADGCTGSASGTVTIPSALSGNLLAYDARCGQNNGAITPAITGGTTPYRYDWSDIAGTDNSAGRVDLQAGYYLVTVTDVNGCTLVLNKELVNSSPLVATIASTPATCGGSNGTITINISSGTPPYNFDWSDAPNAINTQDRTGMRADNYGVFIEDNAGCFLHLSTTVTNQGAPSISPQVTHATCPGNSTGSVTLSVSNGTPPYSYAWAGSNATTSSRSGLAGGTYSVTVTDVSNCKATANLVVNQPAPYQVSATETPVSCAGGNNGAITLTVSGANGSYQFDWADITGNDNAQNRSSLAAGAYTVTIRDGQNCTTSTTANVTAGASIQVALTSTAVRCAGTDGTVIASVLGGSAPYTYTWNTGATASSLTGLAGGTYKVTVRDATNCSAVGSISVMRSSSALTASATGISLRCGDAANGSINVTVNGGSAPYNYIWSPAGGNSPALTGLPAGVYAVTVTDVNGCTATTGATLTQPPALVLGGTTTVAGCGLNNGTIQLSVSGGTGGYLFDWDHITQSPEPSNLSNLAAGEYSVIVSDANQCNKRASFSVAKTQPYFSVNTQVVSFREGDCYNGPVKGWVTITTPGLVRPYTIDWGIPDYFEREPIPEGTYTMVITNPQGCSASTTYTISPPPPMSVSINVTNPTWPDMELDNEDGRIVVTVSGGTPPYRYYMDDGFDFYGNRKWILLNNNIVPNVGWGCPYIKIVGYGCEDIRLIPVIPPGYDPDACNNLGLANPTEQLRNLRLQDERVLLDQVTLFPNPSTQSFTVTLPVGEVTCQVSVFDALGRLIRTEKATQAIDIAVDEWPAGLYTVQVKLLDADHVKPIWLKAVIAH